MATQVTFKAGDRVAFSAEFCRSIFDYTDTPHWRGVVEGWLNERVVRVRWEGSDTPSHIAAGNLAHVGPNSRFCAC